MIWLSQQGHAGVHGGEPEAEQKALLLVLTDRFVCEDAKIVASSPMSCKR